jgi:hypothetical protein
MLYTTVMHTHAACQFINEAWEIFQKSDVKIRIIKAFATLYDCTHKATRNEFILSDTMVGDKAQYLNCFLIPIQLY